MLEKAAVPKSKSGGWYAAYGSVVYASCWTGIPVPTEPLVLDQYTPFPNCKCCSKEAGLYHTVMLMFGPSEIAVKLLHTQ